MAAILLTSLARAQLILTFSDVAIADETVVVGAKTYTFKASPTTVDGQVKVGATNIICATNLALAINAGPTGSGTLWGSGTAANSYCTAVDNGDGTVTVKSRTSGLVGNTIPVAEGLTNGAWAGGAVFLAGGVGQLQTLIGTQLTAIDAKMQLNSQMEVWVHAMQSDLAL